MIEQMAAIDVFMQALLPDGQSPRAASTLGQIELFDSNKATYWPCDCLDCMRDLHHSVDPVAIAAQVQHGR
jgi:hypothetical protein